MYLQCFHILFTGVGFVGRSVLSAHVSILELFFGCWAYFVHIVAVAVRVFDMH